MGAETSPVDIQDDAYERVKSDVYFSDVAVIAFREGDISSKINNALAVVTATGGKIGVAVVVLMPTLTEAAPNALFGPMRIDLVFRVLENPVLNTGPNGTGKHGLAICRQLVFLFKNYVSAFLHHGWVMEKPTVVPVSDPGAPQAWEVRMWTTEANVSTWAMFKCQHPLIDGLWAPSVTGMVGDTVTLTCANPGAAIYYTTNGKHPRAGGTGSNLYTGPFQVLTPGKLQAAAYAAGHFPSDVNAKVFGEAVLAGGLGELLGTGGGEPIAGVNP
jgi:hypothetical protein